MSERDVERACHDIANSLQDNGFKVSDSLVRSLEHRVLLPTAKKLYSLCRAYQISPFEVYSWYGIPFERLFEQRMSDPSERTTLVNFKLNEVAMARATGGMPAGESEPNGAVIEELGAQWGESLGPFLLSCAERHFLFAKVGKSDLFLYPLVLPGSLLVIDPGHTELEPHQQGSYWTRPIYVLARDDEYLFGYCEMLSSGRLLLAPHADSPAGAREIEITEDLRILGRVVSIAIPGVDRHFGTRAAPSEAR